MSSGGEQGQGLSDSRRGKFTRKFDREVLNDKDAAHEEASARASAESSALEAELGKIVEILDRRRGWLRERFPDMIEETPAGGSRGLRFVFRGGPHGREGFLELRCRLNESALAIVLESRWEIRDGAGGGRAPRNDYVTFPRSCVDGDRAQKFIDGRIMEFAKTYTHASSSPPSSM